MRASAAFLLLLALPAHGQSAVARPEILVLGTYHMANPGRDLYSTQVDDVLAPRRQQEIAQVIEVLRRFRPTKVAVEVNVVSRRAAEEYAAYRAGRYQLTRNEVDQLGFRLAAAMGLDSIHAVDEDGDFPFYRVRNYAIANGLEDRFEATQARGAARVKAQNAFLATHTSLEMLELLNSDSATAEAVGEYYEGFEPYGEPYEYAGPDLIAAWFQRNLRIYRNIRALATSPDDRILVIFGSGHLGWLRQIVGADPGVKLRTLADLTMRH